MLVESCIPVIPSADLEKSLRFWVDGLGLSMDRAMRRDGRLVGCMVHNERLYFWLNQRAGTPIRPENYHGIQLYWAPAALEALRERLLKLGYPVSEIVNRDYRQTEFFVTDDDGYSHCFGVATDKSRKPQAGGPVLGRGFSGLPGRPVAGAAGPRAGTALPRSAPSRRCAAPPRRAGTSPPPGGRDAAPLPCRAGRRRSARRQPWRARPRRPPHPPRP